MPRYAAVLEGMPQVWQAAESTPAAVPHYAGVAPQGPVVVVVYTHPTCYLATSGCFRQSFQELFPSLLKEILFAERG